MTRFAFPFVALLGALALLISTVGCQTPPTVAKETRERKLEGPEKLLAPVRITPETLIVDARPQFEYSMAHIPRSVNLKWSDFTEPLPAQRGVLQADLYAVARRLARVGISPETPVVVAGSGARGNGEEGRIAWMLAYLGVSNVTFTGIDALKARVSNLVEDPGKGAPLWKPEPIESLNVTRAEVLHAINNRAMFEPKAFRPGDQPVLYRLIDVRDERAYLGQKVPNMESINIPWREFFDASLRPLPQMGERLKAVGVDPSHRIIVLDQDGVASGAVTMALRAYGFSKAGNYSGGLNDLLSSNR